MHERNSRVFEADIWLVICLSFVRSESCECGFRRGDIEARSSAQRAGASFQEILGGGKQCYKCQYIYSPINLI